MPIRSKGAYRRLGQFALLAIGLLAASAAYASSSVLVVGKAADPDNIDPHVSISSNSYSVYCPAYEQLMKVEMVAGKYTGKIVGSLASSWETAPDGKTWTFRLKPGSRFADGSMLDAHAVAYTFDRMKKIGKGPTASFPTLVSVEAVDAGTVKFNLNAPFPPLLSALSSCPASIINPEVAKHDQNGDQGQAFLADKTMGSGAFQVSTWEKGEQIVLTRNLNYTGEKPRLDQVIFKIIKEASVRRLQVEKGDIDIAEEIAPDQLVTMKGKPGLDIIDQPSSYITYLYLNTKRDALKDVKVRQALSYAIDYKAIIDGVMGGSATQLRGILPSTMPGYDPNVMQFSYDPDKARQLLKQAGVEKASLNFLYTKTDPSWEPIAIATREYLGAVGIDVKLESAAYAPMRERLDKGDFDISIGYWGPDFADQSQFLSWMLDSKFFGLAGNRAFYKNDKVDMMLGQAATETDTAKRDQLFRDVQATAVEEAPYVLLFQRNFQLAMTDKVAGFSVNPFVARLYNFDTMSKAP